MVVVLYIYMWSVNKKRDREAAVSGSQLTAEQEKEAIERGMQVCVHLRVYDLIRTEIVAVVFSRRLAPPRILVSPYYPAFLSCFQLDSGN
jgi:hypothetical protein